jgi:hypothetical protein
VAAASVGGELQLQAPGYTGGRLDWTSFDHDRSGVAPLGASTPAPAPVTLEAVPAPVAFAGMPAHRFWEMEDGQVNLDALEVAPVDLPRMLLAEFVFLQGNDWLLVPWRLEVGSLARVDSLRVRDTFGDVKVVPAARDLDPDWAMFRLSETGLGPRGQALDRHEAFQAKIRRQPSAAPPPPGTPPADAPERRYRLQTSIPDYWIPMVPIQLPGSTTEFRLRRGLLDRAGGPLPALGRVLVPERALVLHDEEIPRSGARVVRTFRLTRWTAGQTPLWIRRKRTISRGGASSGLRYDFLE